jgi:hypothetical protein
MAKRRVGMTWWECAVVLTIVVGLAALLWPAVRAARRAAQRSQRCNAMRQVGLGFMNFADTYKKLPPAVRTDDEGRPLSSWRFQISPFLEAMMRGIDLDDAWDDPVNRHYAVHPHGCFCLREAADRTRGAETNVMAITGPDTPLDGQRDRPFSELDADTILAVEVAHSETIWAEPGDLNIDELPESLCQGLDGDGLHVLFADGTVWFLRNDVPLAELRKFFTIDGAKRYDREQVLGSYAVRAERR